MIAPKFLTLSEFLQYRVAYQSDQVVYNFLQDGKVASEKPSYQNQMPPSQQIVIVHPETHCTCAENQVGEIWVAGPSIAQGYWNHPENTQASFDAYLADTRAGPFLRTGDLGFLKHGELFVTGRLKDLIIIRGRNHYPQDIELTVQQAHPALCSGCGAAFAINADSEEKLVVVQEVERRRLRHLNVVEIVQTIRQAIVERHDLQVYAILLLKTGSIPKTANGKVQRYACKQSFQIHTLNVVGDWLENPRHKAGLIQLEKDLDKLEQQIAGMILSQKQCFPLHNKALDHSPITSHLYPA